MFFKRPSLRRGGMPTGIDTLSPRVEAQSGFFGQRPLFFGDYKQIGLDFPSTMSGMQIPTGNQIMMKSFPQDASAMGVASVAKKPLSSTQKLDQEMNEMIEMGGYGEIEKGPETDLTKLPNFLLKAIGTEETRKILKDREKGETTDKSETSDDGFLPNPGPEKGINFDTIAKNVVTDKDVKSKDTETGGETVEDSFDSEYDKQMKRLEKYLGSTNRETKGKVALALSDAIGTEGTIADKASALNKSLLGILGERKKDRRELAKIAFAATSELEKARILADKPSEYEKRRNRYITLKNKKELSDEEKTELTALTSELGLDKSDKLSLTDAGRLTEMLGDITANIDDYEKEKDPALKAELEAEIRNAVLNVLQAKGVNQNIILSQEPRIKGFLKLADGGRVNKAMGGGASETPAEPVATNLSFEQLRTRLPKEITDDIVRLVATSEEALQDFAYIRTQGDVEKFNVKYGVNLVLPQNTA